MRHSIPTSRADLFISILLAIAFLASSCQQIPSTPEELSKKITEEIVKADPKATGLFFDSEQMLSEEQLVVIYYIARQDNIDDPWRSKREINFLFRPAPSDPEAPGGWYLQRIGGEYLEFLGIGEGVQFDWEFEYFRTENGPREGIIGLAGMQNLR